MKVCPNCGAVSEDANAFCINCGFNFSGVAPQPAPGPAVPPVNRADAQSEPKAAPQPAPQPAPAQQNSYYGATPAAPAVNEYDHTDEFDAEDISKNKIFCMFMYLSGIWGLIIAMLAGSDSPYVAFHVRQLLKIQVVDLLVGLAGGLLVWSFLAPIAALVMSVILMVVKIICFIQVCCGKAIEPAIIRKWGFLK